MSASVRVALIDDDHAGFRRWSYSAMLVAALHGAAAMAVLAWHVTNRPFHADGSSAAGAVFIDLAPLPVAPSPEKNLPPAANRDSGAESLGLQRSATERGANSPGADAPIAPSPQESTTRDGGGGVAASHAFAGDAVAKSPAEVGHGLRVDPGPLDISITVTHPLYPHKSFSVFDRNRMMLLRPTHPGQAEPSTGNPGALTNTPGAHGISSHGSLDHRPGAHVEDRVNAAIERQELLRRMEHARNGNTAPGTSALGIKNATGTSVHGNTRNAIGAASANDGKSGVIGGTVRNAIGMMVEAHPSAHGASVDGRGGGVNGLKAGVSPGSTELKTAAAPTGILNGHGMTRAGTGLTALGGPARTVTGLLNGSDFHPKR